MTLRADPMTSHAIVAATLLVLLTTSIGETQRTSPPVPAGQAPIIDLWSQGKPAFGVFVPNESPRRGRGQPAEQPATATPPYSVAGGEQLAANPLYDYVFLNLEGGYDAAHVRAIAEGLRRGAGIRKALLVRIPPISRDGADVTKTRVREILEAGADGVVFPHIRNAGEAREAIGFFETAGADVWSPKNPSGDRIAMLMLEDPDAVAAVDEIAALPGYSILACVIGSLRSALGGDREAAEAGVQRVLAASKRAGLVNMLTANTQDVATRIEQGFLALLMQGQNADEAIGVGRRVAGR
jgi:2-keto-3-deoxy-L-rhamnonate aldolase RhmA